MQQVDRARIKELRAWAKENIAQREVYHSGLGNLIKFTMTGIKEYLNQPHEFYNEKNELITDIQRIIECSEYMGFVTFKNRISHIFEIKINEKNSWLIANDHQGRGITLYSISDSAKVLTDITK